MLRSGADTTAVVEKAHKRDGVKADHTYSRALKGFAAKLDKRQKQDLEADPNVLAVVPDAVITMTQTIPTGVSRVNGRLNPIAKIDGTDQRVDADVAIVDTGIAYHPDLNVAGGYNCSTADHTAWRDVEHHGTHVAGIVAALDNSFVVVGVAPGARVWGVKILNDDGNGLISWYVCGLDWILAQRDPVDPTRPLFEAVNMSVTKYGSDDHNCGLTNKDVLHQAICRVVAGGITVVAAAANDSHDAAMNIPASYDEVITVSALADTDGKPGGLGGNACYSWGGYDKDDTFADFSNYGGDVDIMAPGKCILSTIPGGYGTMSGTSMAAPTVTGAVALYKASRPKATPAEVREALRYLGNFNWKTSTDPDSVHEHAPRRLADRRARDLHPRARQCHVPDGRGKHDGLGPGLDRPQPDVLRARRAFGHGASARLDRRPGPVERDRLDGQHGRGQCGRAEGHTARPVHDRRPGQEPGPNGLDEAHRQRGRGLADRPAADHVTHPRGARLEIDQGARRLAPRNRSNESHRRLPGRKDE